jgi:hypothetical protein
MIITALTSAAAPLNAYRPYLVYPVKANVTKEKMYHYAQAVLQG